MPESPFRPTRVSSVEATLDSARPILAERDASRADRHPRDRCGCVALVEGSKPPEMTGELEPLLRRRLRLAAVLLFGGFAVFLVRHGFLVEPDRASVFLFASHIAVTVVLGLAAGLLCHGCAISLTWLRLAELAVFACPAAFVAAMQYVMAAYYASHGQFVLEAGPWLMLIFSYALFVPNTIRRAAIVIGVMTVVPIALMFVILWTLPSVAALATPIQVTGVPLMLVVAGFGAVFGVDTIGNLRREAFEARQLGQYLLKKRIGEGGMGEVYLAEHQLLKRPCVIKLIRPDKAGDPRTLARFEREVRATARLSHWNTVEIFDYGSTADGVFYYVMEYLPGMSLAGLVDGYGPLPPERAIYLLRQACDALAEAHGAGLIHRDIKPGNIFVAQRGGVFDVVKLLDFGLVKPLAEEQSIELTSEGSITGSPLFMSPEQASGDREPGPASDIYSLGAVAYYLVTGRPPFDGDKAIKILIAHIHEEVVPPSRHRADLPHDLEQLILKCLAKDPADRFQDTASLEEALAQCEAAGGWSRTQAARWWRSQEEPAATS